MKRNIIAIMMVMVALLATQCKKSAEPLANEPAGETMEVTVRVENNTAKTDITATGVVTWKQGDKLYVVGETQGLLGFVSAVADGDPVQFEGEITALTSAQVLRFYYVGDKGFTLDGSNYTFNLGSQDGTLEGIAAHSQLMWGKTTSTIAVGTANFGTITMTSQMSIAHLNIKDGDNAVAGPVTVTGGFATSTFNAKTYDGTTLSGTADDITMTFPEGTASTNCYLALLPGEQTLNFSADGKEATLAAKAIAANKFYNEDNAVEVAVKPSYLPGEFTVDGSGTKVKFSRGNLYYDGSSWNFESNQYDYRTYVGKNSCIGGSVTANGTPSDHWGLFGWSGSTATTAAWGMSTSSDWSAYSGNFKDWGKNAIGTDAADTWRTLTYAEWYYLLNTSNASSGARTDVNRFAKAMVNDVKGLLIFPDGYNGGEAIGTITGVAALNTTGVDYPMQSIPDATWTSMESAGVVFLPAAGRRYGTKVEGVGSFGIYWSSTPNEVIDAYGMYFGSGGVLKGSYRRYYANSVRLVRSAS